MLIYLCKTRLFVKIGRVCEATEKGGRAFPVPIETQDKPKDNFEAKMWTQNVLCDVLDHFEAERATGTQNGWRLITDDWTKSSIVFDAYCGRSSLENAFDNLVLSL